MFYLSPAPVGRFPSIMLGIIREHTASDPEAEHSNNFSHRPTQTITDGKDRLQLYGELYDKTISELILCLTVLHTSQCENIGRPRVTGHSSYPQVMDLGDPVHPV